MRHGTRRALLMFDVQNTSANCDTPYQAETLAMEREAYELIRSAAPTAHVAMLSFGSTPTASALEAISLRSKVQ